MAQDRIINVTVDANMASKPDRADHRHSLARGAAASGDMTLSFDKSKFTRLSQLRGAVEQALQIAAGELPT